MKDSRLREGEFWLEGLLEIRAASAALPRTEVEGWIRTLQDVGLSVELVETDLGIQLLPAARPARTSELPADPEAWLAEHLQELVSRCSESGGIMVESTLRGTRVEPGRLLRILYPIDEAGLVDPRRSELDAATRAPERWWQRRLSALGGWKQLLAAAALVLVAVAGWRGLLPDLARVQRSLGPSPGPIGVDATRFDGLLNLTLVGLDPGRSMVELRLDRGPDYPQDGSARQQDWARTVDLDRKVALESLARGRAELFIVTEDDLAAGSLSFDLSELETLAPVTRTLIVPYPLHQVVALRLLP